MLQRRYSADQLRKRADMKANLVKTVALKQTTQVVNEHLQHTIRVKAVAEKYVEYVWLISDELLEKYPGIHVALSIFDREKESEKERVVI